MCPGALEWHWMETDVTGFAMRIAAGIYGESLNDESSEKLRGSDNGSDGVLDWVSFLRRASSSFLSDLILSLSFWSSLALMEGELSGGIAF